MRTALALAAAATAVLMAAGPAAADDGTASPSPAITTAGTSFLTATPVQPGRSVQVSASTGDYLYWSFAASAGQTDRITATVDLPAASARHGAATWSLDVFDGLRRRQACTTGRPAATASATVGSVALSCTLRQVRSWAEPWSSDPLPGTYYVRLSLTGVPEQDLGLAVQAHLELSARGGGDPQPEGGSLKAELVPPVAAGATLAPDAVISPSPEPSPSPSESESESESASGTVAVPRPVAKAEGWFSGLSSRWFWTAGGGVLAALAGVAGYSLTRHPRRWFSR